MRLTFIPAGGLTRPRLSLTWHNLPRQVISPIFVVPQLATVVSTGAQGDIDPTQATPIPDDTSPGDIDPTQAIVIS